MRIYSVVAKKGALAGRCNAWTHTQQGDAERLAAQLTDHIVEQMYLAGNVLLYSYSTIVDGEINTTIKSSLEALHEVCRQEYIDFDPDRVVVHSVAL